MTSQTEIEKFMASKMFRCTTLHATITPEQCERNRTRKGNRIEGHCGGPPQCASCDWEVMQLNKPDKPKTEVKTVGRKAKRAICVCCNEGPKNIVCHGLCGKCYRYESRGELSFEDGEWIPANGEIAERLNLPWEGEPVAQEHVEAEAPAVAVEAVPEPDPEPDLESKPGTQFKQKHSRKAMPTCAELLAGFQQYDPARLELPGEPLLSIQRSGKISLNSFAARAFLNGCSHAQLFWDSKQRRMAIRLTKDPDAAMTVTRSKYAATVEGRGFIRSMGLELDELAGQRIPIERVADDLLFATLPAEAGR